MTNEFPGSNSLASLREDTRILSESVDAWVAAGEIIDDSRAADAGDLLRQLNAHIKEIDEARRAEAKPFDDGKAAVQARYRPLADMCEVAKGAVKKMIDAYLRKKQGEHRRIAAEAAARAAEEARIAALAAASARTIEDIAAAQKRGEEAAANIERAREAATARARVESNFAGERALVIRRGPAKVRIVDLRAAAGWAFRHRKDELTSAVERILTYAVRDGHGSDIPGIEIYREESVA